MRRLQRPSIWILLILATVMACAIPNVTITDPIAQATFQALTIEAAIRGTQQSAGPGTPSSTTAASPTVTETASPTATGVPSLTPTGTQSPTPVIVASSTPPFPSISVTVPTNCRSGTGRDYPIEGALLVGETAQVLARDPTGEYFYIPNPDSLGDYCWVWGEYAVLSGFLGALPVYTPPPKPTATFTPTPAPGFGASYDGMVGCTGSWWIQIALENTSLLTFRSIEFTIRDLDLDISASDENDAFVSRPDCSSSVSKVSLEPDKTVIVSSPALDNNPNGHRMRATISLCTKVGQEGTCVTKTIRFTP